MAEFFGRFFLPHLKIQDIEQKSVFITGCDTGFGHLIALDLNKAGFMVFAGCLFPEKEEAKSLMSKCKNQTRMVIVPLNVTNELNIKLAYETVNQVLTTNQLQLWAVINNAGIGVMGEFEWGSFDKQVRNVLEVNTIGVALVTRTFLPLIKKSKGRIININSMASRYASPGMVSYAMAKHASLAFTEGLRREMFRFEVKVISIEPYFYPTQIINRDLVSQKGRQCWDETDEQVKQSYGGKFFQKYLSAYQQFDSENNFNDPKDVSDTVHHAVIARYPKWNYPVAPPVTKFFLWLGQFIQPQEIVELLWKLLLTAQGINQPMIGDDENQDDDKDQDNNLKNKKPEFKHDMTRSSSLFTTE